MMVTLMKVDATSTPGFSGSSPAGARIPGGSIGARVIRFAVLVGLSMLAAPAAVAILGGDEAPAIALLRAPAGPPGSSQPPADATPATPAPAQPIAALAKATAESQIDRAWEARFEHDISALAASGAVGAEPSLTPLARRLAEIVKDRTTSPQAHAGLDRYRRSEADLARREGRQVTSIRAVNRPPALLPEHRDAGLRLAWEGLLLGAGWWQTVELSAEVLRSMDPRPSAEVLGVSLVRSVRGFDRSTDQGWRERAILSLIAILSEVPDAEVLRRFAEADEATGDAELRERLVFAIARNEAWRPVVDAAGAEGATSAHASFVGRIVERRGTER